VRTSASQVLCSSCPPLPVACTALIDLCLRHFPASEFSAAARSKEQASKRSDSPIQKMDRIDLCLRHFPANFPTLVVTRAPTRINTPCPPFLREPSRARLPAGVLWQRLPAPASGCTPTVLCGLQRLQLQLQLQQIPA
jgi:hypothetical protein